ncbi:hypothetical protein Tco_0819877 [Tanacetum coccineum]|uniref:Gag-Pol polyprotein n=1 Tax=Tanacetum coccineum TaxID=301880 RepID=A0ABQ5ABT0_9ASTR
MPTKDRVILEHPTSSSRTLSSLQNLEKDLSFTDQFFVEKPQEEEPGKTNAEAEVYSMVLVLIHQDTSSVPPMTTPVIDLTKSQSDSPLPTSTATISTITTTTPTLLPPPPQPQQSTTDPILVKRIGELEQHMADLIQNNLALEESPVSEGSSETTTERNMENYRMFHKTNEINLMLKLMPFRSYSEGIDNDINSTLMLRKFTSWDGESLESYYSQFYKMMNELVRNQCHVTNHQVNVQFLLQLQPEWQRNRGKAIVTSSAPTYDPEPATVTEDDEMSKEKEIDKLMALISLSFKKIYKPTNNNLRTSSNTSRANQDNSPRINRGTGYDNQRAVNVAGARENVGTPVVQKSGIQFKVTPDPVDNSGPIFDDEPMHKVQNNNDNYNVFAMENEHPEQPESSNHIYLAKQDLKKFQAELDKVLEVNMPSKVEIDCAKAKGDLINKELDKVIALENKVKVLNDIVYKTGQSVQTMNMLNRNCKTSFAKPEFLKKAQRANPRLYDIGCYNDNLGVNG